MSGRNHSLFSKSKLKNFVLSGMSCLVVELFLFQPLHNFFLNYKKDSKISDSFRNILNEYRARNLQIWLIGLFFFSLIILLKLKKNKSFKENSKEVLGLLTCSLSCVLIELIFFEPIHEFISHYSCRNHSNFDSHIIRNYSNYYSEKPKLFWICAIFCLIALFAIEHSTLNKNRKTGESKFTYFIHFFLCALTCFAFELIFLEPLHHVFAHSVQNYNFSQVFDILIDGYIQRPISLWVVAFSSLLVLYCAHSFFESNNFSQSHYCAGNGNEESYLGFVVKKVTEIPSALHHFVTS
jgi:hypothetical protein